MIKCLRIGVVGFFACCVVAAVPQEQNADKGVAAKQSQTFALESSPIPASTAASEADLRKKLEQQPASADILYRLALVLRLEHKYRESLDLYTRAAGLEKPDAGELHSVAMDYVQLNDYDDAIRWLRVALGLDPSNVDVLYSLGRCFYTESDLLKAEAAFTRVLQLQPDHLKAEENLGLTYNNENKPELAEKALRTAADWAIGATSMTSGPTSISARSCWTRNARQRLCRCFKKPSQSIRLRPLRMRSWAAHCWERENQRMRLRSWKRPSSLTRKMLGCTSNLAAHIAKRVSQTRLRAEFDISKTLYGTHNQD